MCERTKIHTFSEFCSVVHNFKKHKRWDTEEKKAKKHKKPKTKNWSLGSSCLEILFEGIMTRNSELSQLS